MGEFTGLKPDAAWDLHAGEPVVLSVRPESWEAARGRTGTDGTSGNVVRGRIGRRVYLGELAEYDFPSAWRRGSAATGVLKVFELNPRFLETPDDAEVAVEAAPADVIVLHP